MKSYLLIFLISIYLFSILFFVNYPVNQYSILGFLAFVVSHVALYFIVIGGKFSFIQNKFGNIKSILILAFFLRILFFWHPTSDDLARYAWEGKKVSQGVNPYVNAPQWFTNSDIQDMNLADKSALILLIENEKSLKISQLNADDLNQQLTVFANQLITDKNLPEKLKKITNKENIKSVDLPVMVQNELIDNNRLLLSNTLLSLKDDFQKKVNHKQMTALYPPIALLVFGVLMKISYSVAAFKVLFFVCEIISIIFIVKLLIKYEKPVQWSLLYVMSPLILLYGVGECHMDILQNVFLLSGVYLLQFACLKRWVAMGFLLLGCAVLTKYLAVIVVPFLVSRKNINLLFFFLIPFLSFLYFWEPGMWSSLETFSGQMHFNDAIPKVIRGIFVDGGVAYQLFMIGIYVLGYLLIFLFYQDVPLKGILLSWVWLLLCLPVFHPWYLVSILSLACFYPMRSIMFLSMIMGLYFFVLEFQFNHSGEWIEFWWLPVFTYFGFISVILIEKLFFNPISADEFLAIKQLDIVIPVFNESKKVPALLDNLFVEADKLKHQKIKVNVLVVDGGSTDETIIKLKKYPVRILISEQRGRGNQLALGYEKSTSDLVLFLHADSILKSDALTKMVAAFQKNPSLAWGVLGHVYDEKKIKLKFIEILNYFRFNYLGIAFGDQGMFFRREVLAKINAPKIPLMEDVEISLRLFRYPNRINLNGLLIGSARRWVNRNFFNSFFQVIYLCLKYIVCRSLGVNVQQLSEKMYKSYYSK